MMPILGSIRSLSLLENAEKPFDLLTLEKHLDRIVPNRKKIIFSWWGLVTLYILIFHAQERLACIRYIIRKSTK